MTSEHAVPELSFNLRKWWWVWHLSVELIRVTAHAQSDRMGEGWLNGEFQKAMGDSEHGYRAYMDPKFTSSFCVFFNAPVSWNSMGEVNRIVYSLYGRSKALAKGRKTILDLSVHSVIFPEAVERPFGVGDIRKLIDLINFGSFPYLACSNRPLTGCIHVKFFMALGCNFRPCTGGNLTVFSVILSTIYVWDKNRRIWGD